MEKVVEKEVERVYGRRFEARDRMRWRDVTSGVWHKFLQMINMWLTKACMSRGVAVLCT